MSEAVIQGFRRQALNCAALGSPFSAAMLNQAANAPDVIAALTAPWAVATVEEVSDAAVPLRFLGGLHDLVLDGAAPALAAHYPTEAQAGDPQAGWAAAREAVGAHRERLVAFMTHEPQTNEVGRSGVLLGGFLELEAAFGLPLRLFELGASAGLNQMWDRFHYRLGGGEWGPPSAVELTPEWRGGPPRLSETPRVGSRAACDRKPVDLNDPVQRRRLQAYVWPDQFERLARLRAAIDIAVAAGVSVDAADAVDWTRRIVPEQGATTVIYHSIFWQYLPPPTQAALAEAIAALGAQAAPAAPIAWLRMEPDSGNFAFIPLRLTTWPGGEQRDLAGCHPHGGWVDWRA